MLLNYLPLEGCPGTLDGGLPIMEKCEHVSYTKSFINGLLEIDVLKKADVEASNKPRISTLELQEMKNDKGVPIRKRCHGCYLDLKSQGFNAKVAAKKTSTSCIECSQAYR
ncbi:hypothetical protein JTB14_004482 [Gonioctena quinquepunctata]|nr:hypothetical protein JTB14_004482 [Gonioctena quinquepunctata]